MGTPRIGYQGTPAQPPTPTVVVGSGAITSAKAGSKTIWLQYRNRAGYSLVSTSVTVSVAAGQGISVTIPSSALPTPNGSYIYEYLVLLAETNDPNDACVVATQYGYQADETTIITPPFTITLNADEHLELGKTVADVDSLPLTVKNGMRRYITELNEIRAYSSRDGGWIKVFPQVFNTYVSAIDAVYGASRNISNITDTSVIYYPSYGFQADTASTPVGFWLSNVGTTAIAKGTRIGLTVELDGVDISTTSGVIGGLKLRFLGYANVVTGVLDTSGEGGAGTMPLVYDGTNEIDYNGPNTGLILAKDLEPNRAYVLTVSAAFSSAELNNGIPQGAVLKFSPYFYATFASINPLAGLSGSFIANKSKQRRIVPGSSLSAIALDGAGTLDYGPGFNFGDIGAQEVIGLTANTANQIIAITINGTCLKVSSLPNGALQRALVGTLNGTGKPTAWSSAIALTGATVISLNVTYPTAIRDDYPDVIASSSDGTFNATYVVVYVRPNGGGNVTRWEYLITPGEASQTFTVGATAGTNIGSGALPTRPSEDFGLFEPADDSYTAVSAAGSSVFSAGNYQVAIAFRFADSVTSITHDPLDGCIEEAAGTIIDAIGLRRYWAEPVASATAMRALSRADVYDLQSRVKGNSNKPYRFFAASLAVDDGSEESYAIKLDETDSSEPGRFLADESSQILYGSGAPSGSLGFIADFYIDETNGDIYSKTGTSTWTLIANFRGSKIYVDDAVPVGADGVIGDIHVYLNSANPSDVNNGNFYQKTGVTTWTLQGSIKGATGAAGSVSAASSIILNQATPPTTSATQAAIVHDVADSKVKIVPPSSGNAQAIALLSTFQTFTRTQAVLTVTLTPGATVAVDASLSNTFSLLLTQNTTVSNPTNLINGGVYNFLIKQDSTGGWTLTLGSAYKPVDGIAPAIGTDAGDTTILTGISDGTNIYYSLFGVFPA